MARKRTTTPQDDQNTPTQATTPPPTNKPASHAHNAAQPTPRPRGRALIEQLKTKR